MLYWLSEDRADQSLHEEVMIMTTLIIMSVVMNACYETSRIMSRFCYRIGIEHRV